MVGTSNARAGNGTQRFCAALKTGGFQIPPYIAVIARWAEDVAWTKRLPIPSIVYEHAKPSAFYNVPVNKGSEASAYLQFILDHYACLPRWVLFLHGHGQTISSGSRPAVTRHHPTNPAKVAALIDVEKLGKAFVGLCHFSQEDYDKPKSLGPVARKWGFATSPRFHAAFVDGSEGKHPCRCEMFQAIFGSADGCPKVTHLKRMLVSIVPPHPKLLYLLAARAHCACLRTPAVLGIQHGRRVLGPR